jgi:L-asparaginase
MAGLPSVLAVFTGGTISMKVVPGRGAVPARSGREILDRIPEMAEIARVTFEDFDRLPGPHWTPTRMLALARHLDLRLAEGRFVGAVVTHGTDTLEETAYLLDLVLRAEAPVVLTGAMNTADDPAWDGPANLTAAVRAAIALSGRGGAAVVMSGTIHAARGVTKSDTASLDAFTSSGGESWGTVAGGRVELGATAPPRERIEARGIEERVDLVTAAAGADARLIDHAVATGARGIVVAALGMGNLPPAMAAGVGRAVDAGLPVVVASRCAHGATAAKYGYEGGGVTLRDAGALFAGDLSAVKARIKLMVLLGAGASPGDVRASFERR